MAGKKLAESIIEALQSLRAGKSIKHMPLDVQKAAKAKLKTPQLGQPDMPTKSIADQMPTAKPKKSLTSADPDGIMEGQPLSKEKSTGFATASAATLLGLGSLGTTGDTPAPIEKQAAATLASGETPYTEGTPQPQPTPEGGGDVSSYLIPLINAEEGFKAQPYDDGVGNMTIGYGHKIDGDDWKQFDKDNDGALSEGEAAELRDADIKKHSSWKSGLKVEVSPRQEAAITSLAFNMGPNHEGIKDIVGLINEGSIAEAGDAFLKYDSAKDESGDMKKLDGLTKRRANERKLFLSGADDAPASLKDLPLAKGLEESIDGEDIDPSKVLPPAVEGEKDIYDLRPKILEMQTKVNTALANYKKEKDSIAAQEKWAGIIQGVSMIVAGIYAMKNDVDISGMKFNPADFSSKYAAADSALQATMAGAKTDLAMEEKLRNLDIEDLNREMKANDKAWSRARQAASDKRADENLQLSKDRMAQQYAKIDAKAGVDADKAVQKNRDKMDKLLITYSKAKSKQKAELLRQMGTLASSIGIDPKIFDVEKGILWDSNPTSEDLAKGVTTPTPVKTTVTMTSPDGRALEVPADEVAKMEAAGAKRN